MQAKATVGVAIYGPILLKLSSKYSILRRLKFKTTERITLNFGVLQGPMFGDLRACPSKNLSSFVLLIRWRTFSMKFQSQQQSVQLTFFKGDDNIAHIFCPPPPQTKKANLILNL